VVVVTDNGPAYRSIGFARFIASRPELLHVRTRHRSPQTNGVIERFYQAINYEHLYRHEINDGLVLAREVENYLTVYNTPSVPTRRSASPPRSPATCKPRPPRRGPTFNHPQLSQILDAGQAATWSWPSTTVLAAPVSGSRSGRKVHHRVRRGLCRRGDQGAHHTDAGAAGERLCGALGWHRSV
jgi:transposase InsO family protein